MRNFLTFPALVLPFDLPALPRCPVGAFVREILTSAFYFAVPCLFVALILAQFFDLLWQHTLGDKLANFYKYVRSAATHSHSTR